MNDRMAKRPMRQRVTLELEGAGAGVPVVVLTRCRFQCTYCGLWLDAGEFGLRVMRDGVVRNQPRCAPCRRHLGAGKVDSTPKAMRRRARKARQLELELEGAAPDLSRASLREDEDLHTGRTRRQGEQADAKRCTGQQ